MAVPSSFIGDESALEDRGKAMYTRGGYRIDSRGGLGCEENHAGIAWMCSERDMPVDRKRVHFHGLCRDSKPFVERKTAMLVLIVIGGLGPAPHRSSGKSVRRKSD